MTFYKPNCIYIYCRVSPIKYTPALLIMSTAYYLHTYCIVFTATDHHIPHLLTKLENSSTPILYT